MPTQPAPFFRITLPLFAALVRLPAPTQESAKRQELCLLRSSPHSFRIARLDEPSCVPQELFRGHGLPSFSVERHRFVQQPGLRLASARPPALLLPQRKLCPAQATDRR